MDENNNEREIGALHADVDGLKRQLVDVNRKLDEILDLRSRGQGIFWFVCTALGCFAVIGLSKFEKLFSLFSDRK